MTKAEEFLWGVQTMMLLYANLHAHDPEVRANPAHISAGGNEVNIVMALVASKRIPDDLKVGDAIHDFHYAYVNPGREAKIPAWLFALTE